MSTSKYPFSNVKPGDVVELLALREAGSPLEATGSLPPGSCNDGNGASPSIRAPKSPLIPLAIDPGEQTEEMFDGIIGSSSSLQEVLSKVRIVAPTESTVLILGETGTGKELVAHALHNQSARRNRPFVPVNCASIPKDLFESELFGHARGAFTGAVKDRIGRFESAEGGTIFLDEIGEVPLEMQSKLLRVLQEKRYERVGEDRARLANVRIIAATNRDLKLDVAQGRFREDLYYRLNVFPVHVPPLRQRLEDVPLLAMHFIEISTRDMKCTRPRLNQSEISKLQTYAWPGNVRELRNLIERAVILAQGRAIEFDLPIGSGADAIQPQPAHNGCHDENRHFLTEVQMRQRERDNLLAVLAKTNWKIKGRGGAAELLGVKATTLLSRMNAMGLKRPDRSGSAAISA